MKNKILIFFALILVASCFAGCGGDDRVYRAYSEIKEAGKVIIGVSADNIPLSYADENGEYQGYEIRFAKRLAKEMGVKLKFISTESHDRAKYLKTGKVDIVISDYAVTKSARKAVDFASPYMKRALGTVSKKGKKLNTIENLGKKDKVIVVSDSRAAEYMAENYPKLKLCECGDESEAINCLKANKGVLWIDENTKVSEFALEHEEDYVAGDAQLGKAVEYAPAVSKGNKTLVKKINKIIGKLNKEDFFSADYQETLKNVYGKDFVSAFVVEHSSQ